VLRCFRLGVAGFFVALSLPVLAVSFLIAVTCTASYLFLLRFCTRNGGLNPDLRRLWAADEFRFDSAVRSYEDLIDACAQRQS